ncbi:MAG TPA: iron-containing alcohol dehydrogenase, partial [Flavisolibacter sp.]|nr:iron-containing alcohol dehydrogenase [Flavisolibacter sp.]
MRFQTIYQYNFPTIIRFGVGAAGELGDYLKKNNLMRPLIVTDGNVAELKFFKSICAALDAKNISVEVFCDIHKNPVKSDVYNGTEVFDNATRDSVIGIGGGAALDVARAIVLRVHHRDDLFKYDDLIGGDIFVTN